MKVNMQKSFLNIAELHVKNLQEALDDLASKYPFTQDFILHMKKEELRILDTMTYRFSKLQDLIGSKIIDLFLMQEAQYIDGMSMLDKIHKLEKLHILENEDTWLNLRDTRNHIAQEYPDNPALAANKLNDVYMQSSVLIDIYTKLKNSLTTR